MAIDKEFYNKSSADSLGWEPSWFGCDYFDSTLTSAIRKWQRKNNLTADGLCGPATYRRVWTDREARISDYKPNRISRNFDANRWIVHNGKFIPIEWKRVVLWDENGGLDTKKGNYYDYSGKEERNPSFFVNHWDVCLSSESCASVLKRRGASVHFCIDNDGTIYQLLDTQHGAWHAGGQKWNQKSIGVEISNAYYTKYQDWYEKNGFDARPTLEDSWAHGRKLDPHLGFYPVQIEAARALWKAVHIRFGIPLACPLRNSQMTTTVSSDAAKGRFEGFIHHYHLTKRKIDCAGFDLESNLQIVRQSPMYCLDR